MRYALISGLLTTCLAFTPGAASADCALIPAAIKVLLSNDGGVDRPFGAPGDVVTVFSDGACKTDADEPHFDPLAANNEITLVFQPPTGGTAPTVVPLPADEVDPAACGEDRCFALSFTMPNTTGRAGAFPLTGPARIEVRNTAAAGNPVVASIDELFEPTKGCNPLNRRRNLFRNFTVLPPRNSYPPLPGVGINLDATVDGTGAILIPFDYTNVLVAITGGTGSLRLLKVNADIPNGLDSAQKDAILGPGHPDRDLARIPQEGSYARSFAFNGRPIPPLLEVTSTGGLTAADTAAGAGIDFGDTLLGSVDFIDSVIRIANTGPATGMNPIFAVGGPGGVDLETATDGTFGATGPVGPIRLTGVTLGVGAVAPLNSLKSSKRVAVVARDERLEATVLFGSPNQNPDGDQDDQVVEFSDLETGEPISTGQAVASLEGKAVIAAAGTTVAFLLSEAHQTDSGSPRVDLNGDDDAFDQILRVWTADGSHPSCSGSPCELTSSELVVDPRPQFQGPTGLPSPIVVSGPPGDEGRFVFFGRSEVISSPVDTERLSLTATGQETIRGSSDATVSGDAFTVAFVTEDAAVAPALNAEHGYYRIESPAGSILRYPTFEDFVADTNAAGLGTVGVYANDAGFFYQLVQKKYYRVSDAGGIFVYPLLGDFLTDSNAVTYPLLPTYGDDAGFLYSTQPGGGYFRFEDDDDVLAYSSFIDFRTNAGETNLGNVTGYGNSAGFFYDIERDAYLQVDASGTIREFPSLSDLGAGTAATVHGTVAAYGDDAGFFAVPRPSVDQIYARDTFSGASELLSQSDGGEPADCDSRFPALDEDGDVAVFLSCASNLVLGLGGLAGDQVYLRNRALGTTVRVSNTSGGDEPNGFQRSPIVSADGGVVAFITGATDVLPPIPGPGSGLEVVAYDVATTTSELISVDASGERSGRTFQPGLGISADGNLIAFSANVDDLLPSGEDTNGTDDVFVRDRTAGTTERISVGFGGTEPDGPSTQPHMSADGRYVVFRSAATNLLPPDSGVTLPPGSAQCYLYDRQRKVTQLVSRTLSGDGSNGTTCDKPFIDTSGRIVTFTSNADNLFPGSASGRQAYFHDRSMGITALLNREGLTSPSSGTTGARSAVGINGDISLVFETTASDLGDPDTNGLSDIYRIFVDFAAGTSFNSACTAVAGCADTDMFDTVLHVFDTQNASVINTGVPITTVAVDGAVVASDVAGLPYVYVASLIAFPAGSALLAPAASVSVSGTFCGIDSLGNLFEGGSADTGFDATVARAVGSRCVFIETGTGQLQILDGGIPVAVGETAVDFQLGSDGIAFRSCEAAEGDLNLDGDTADCVMRFWYFDAPSPPLTQLVETRNVAIPCTFPGCDPFFEPYRVGPGIVSFVTSEADEVDEGGVGGPGNELPITSPAGVCDKTGDDDGNDVAVEIFSLESFRSQVFPVDADNPPTVPPFPEIVEGDDGDKNVITIQLPAEIAGAAFAALPSEQLVTLIVGDPDGDFVFEADGNQNAVTAVGDGCPETFNPLQIDLNMDDLPAACSFVLDTTIPNDDPMTAPESPDIPGDFPCDDESNLITQAEVDQVWADRRVPIAAPTIFAVQPSDNRDPDADGEITAVDASICSGKCAAQSGGCPQSEVTPPATYCGLGIELTLLLPLLGALRARRRGLH